uniref:CSON008664 protein n=1 Tax=Culicoides sonorensis TaxID=179676 RepID=A0A336K396_CULSO
MSNQDTNQSIEHQNGDGQDKFEQMSEHYQQQQQTKKQQMMNDNSGQMHQQQHYQPQQQQQLHHQQQQQQQPQNDLPIDANYPNMSNNQYHRRFRASRNFKNPPQPHMCIREKTIDGQELFINVLSWNRIADPSDKNSPIPLFGGMKVIPGSSRSPPLVYAVMASPEVLKQAGRKCPDSPERMNLVDLMCEFVEEMNPGLVLSRHPEILKDRDLSGELKDVWNAVQTLRDRQRAENHYATQENLVLYTEFGPETAPPMYQQQQQQQQQQRESVIQYSGQSAINTNNMHNNMQTSTNDVTSLKDHMEKISSETENMRISPTEPTNNGASNDSNMKDEKILPLSNNPNISSSATSVIVSTGNINGGQRSPTHNSKKESTISGQHHSSSTSFLTKFISSKTSQNHHNHHQDQVDGTTNTVQHDTNNKKDTDHSQEPQQQQHQQSKHKKFLSYIRRKTGTKNDNNYSRKGVVTNGDNHTNTQVTTNNSHNGNNEDNTGNTGEIAKQEMMETPIIDAK